MQEIGQMIDLLKAIITLTNYCNAKKSANGTYVCSNCNLNVNGECMIEKFPLKHKIQVGERTQKIIYADYYCEDNLLYIEEVERVEYKEEKK